MPKGRYDIMRAYMPKKGNLGLDMMLRTCTIQANLDFVGRGRHGRRSSAPRLALQPIATALFACSPFTEGKPERLPVGPRQRLDRHRSRPHRHARLRLPGRLRLRDATPTMRWTCRCISPSAARTMSTLSGQSFRDFMDGKLPALPGERPTLKDWDDHLTTLFPEVRLKSVSGDARRRRRAVEPHLRPARPVGRHLLRRAVAGRRLGPLQGLGHRRPRAPAPRRDPPGPARPRSPAARCATSPSTWSPSPARA